VYLFNGLFKLLKADSIGMRETYIQHVNADAYNSLELSTFVNRIGAGVGGITLCF
jgi:hypothetical protein